MATYLSDVEWVDAVYETPEQAPLGGPWLGADNSGFEIAPENVAPHKVFHSVSAVAHAAVFAVCVAANAALFWRLATKPMAAVDVLWVAVMLYGAIAAGKIFRRQRWGVYYRRMYGVSVVAIMGATLFDWLQYGPAEMMGVYLLGVAAAMAIFITAIVSAVVVSA